MQGAVAEHGPGWQVPAAPQICPCAQSPGWPQYTGAPPPVEELDDAEPDADALEEAPPAPPVPADDELADAPPDDAELAEAPPVPPVPALDVEPLDALASPPLPVEADELPPVLEELEQPRRSARPASQTRVMSQG